MQKFIILCIICISNFTAGVTTNPSASVRLTAVLDRSAGQQNSGLFNLFILSHSRTPSASLRGYATPPFGEIWFCRWACSGVYTRGDRRVDRQRDCRADGHRDDRPVCNRVCTATALLAMSLTVYQRPISVFGDSQKEPGGVIAVKNAAAWASCCISRAGMSAGWIVEKVTLCIIRTPNFTVRF